MEQVIITKASGEKVPFSVEKLRKSLKNSGAANELIEQIVQEIQPQLFDGISTKRIYRMAYNLLRSASNPLAAKYHLKKGIMQLGPSGYPFEKFVGEILKAQGYKVQVGVIVNGNCVKHEIDVIAEKDHHHFMVECKYHNQPGITSSVKIPLYIQARFKDVEAEWKKIPGHGIKFHQGWVVTNTRFSNDAISYGSCVGLNMLGWNYPRKGSLKNLIDELRLYPVTCLTSITKAEKQMLLENDVVLCKQLCEDEYILQKIGISGRRIERILEEGRMLCTNA